MHEAKRRRVDASTIAKRDGLLETRTPEAAIDGTSCRVRIRNVICERSL